MKTESKMATHATATAEHALVITFLGTSADRDRKMRQIVAISAQKTAASHAKSVATPHVTPM